MWRTGRNTRQNCALLRKNTAEMPRNRMTTRRKLQTRMSQERLPCRSMRMPRQRSWQTRCPDFPRKRDGRLLSRKTTTWTRQEPLQISVRSAGEDRKLRKMRRERKNRSTRSRQRKSVRSSARNWRSAPQKSGKRWKRKRSAVRRKSGKLRDARKKNAVRKNRRRSTENAHAETRSAIFRLRKRMTTRKIWNWNPWMICSIPTT